MNERATLPNERARDTVHVARMTGLRIGVLWLVAMGIGGLFLGFIGAIDSYTLPLGIRLAFWLGLCLVAALFGIVIEFALERFGRRVDTLLGWVLATLAMAAAMTPVIYVANSTATAPPLTQLGLFFTNALIVSAALIGLRIGLGLTLRDNWTELEDEEAEQGAFTRRLSPGLRSARVIALSAEGHYVCAWTDAGKELVLMRLADAIDEMTPGAGMQVHRGWWVAREAVTEDVRRDGRIFLKLENGEEAPVSRSRAKELRKAGWI